MDIVSYKAYKESLPDSGQQIIASYDDDGVIVYQAYKSTIATFAVKNQKFGGTDYSFNRMSWIKPNFLWMMYRSGWGTKKDQEKILAIKISHEGFRNILHEAIYSSYKEEIYYSRDKWKYKLQTSEVRLQWDPDHDPKGEKMERRAMQLGMKGKVLEKFNKSYILNIRDISDFVTEQKTKINDEENLRVPMEKIYPINDLALKKTLGVIKVQQE